MLRYCIFYCFLICMFLGGCSAHQAGSPAKHRDQGNVINKISIPSDYELIMIPVSFKGKEYQFILDIGATATVFDISLKDQLGWRLPSSKIRAADGKIIKAEKYMARHVHFGGLCKKNISVLAADLRHTSEIAGRRVDGILGLDILKDHVIQLDFEKNEVLFLRSSSFTEFSGCEADLFFKKKHVYTDAKIENIPVRFMIDSGFVNSDFMGLLEPATIEQLGVIGNSQGGDQASTIAGPMEFNQRKTIISNLYIGNFEYENALFVGHHKSILGLNFLSRHIVIFDFPNKKMYLKKIENYDNSSTFSMLISGFDFTVINVNGNIVVESVDTKGLSYKKGLKRNDVILKVNNYDVSAYSLPDLAKFLISLLKEQDLDRLKFIIKRNDEFEEIVFFEVN